MDKIIKFDFKSEASCIVVGRRNTPALILTPMYDVMDKDKIEKSNGEQSEFISTIDFSILLNTIELATKVTFVAYRQKI